MNRRHRVLLASALGFVLGACALAAQTALPQQAPAAAAKPASTQPSVQEINSRFHEKLLKQIAGHEKEPAEKVFENIQIPSLKSTPAVQFLNIMDFGYSRALGVTCTHCHVEDDFSSDAKRPKRAAREMAALHRAINEQLQKMENLEPNPEGHFINCTTCHRGAIDPMAPSK